MLRNCLQLKNYKRLGSWNGFRNLSLEVNAEGENKHKNHEDEFSQHDGVEEPIEKLYASHIPTTTFQKVLLGIGSGLMAITHPERDDMVAVMGETTGQFAMPKMYRMMLRDPEGRQIIKDRPVINSSTVDIPYLRSLPEDTFGYHYTKFLDDNNVTPDSRKPVQFVDDKDLAYIIQRYREAHDLIHTLLGMPTNILGEVAVKWVEGIQTGMPMCVLGGLFGPVRFTPKQRKHYSSTLLPWAIDCGFKSKFLLNIYYEKRWTQSLESMRKELNVPQPPKVPQKKKTNM